MDSGCWEWQGHRDRQGYGRVGRDHKNLAAHRYAYSQVHGEPTGVVRHSCDNPPCVNPDHLLDGTQADNIADRQARGRHRPGRLLGEAHPQAKMTEASVRGVRLMHENGWRTAQIAAYYGVSNKTIRLFVRGLTWTHVEAA